MHHILAIILLSIYCFISQPETLKDVKEKGVYLYLGLFLKKKIQHLVHHFQPPKPWKVMDVLLQILIFIFLARVSV